MSDPMRRTFALWFVTSLMACGCAAGLAAPAALASGSATTATQPSFNLNNAGAAAALDTTTTPASSSSGTSTTSSSGSLSTTDAVIIAVVAALVLGGIAVLVRNDAHKHLAHIRHGDREDPMFATAHSGSKAHKKTRKLTPAERKRRKRGRAR